MTIMPYSLAFIASLIKSSIAFLVYEVATLLCWLLGVLNTKDHTVGLYEIHVYTYSIQMLKPVLLITLALFTYNMLVYIKAIHNK